MQKQFSSPVPGEMAKFLPSPEISLLVINVDFDLNIISLILFNLF